MSRWNTVAIYGVGLIGGSIGKALRAGGFASRVIGVGRHAAKLRRAVELGAITDVCTDLASAEPIDLAVVCTPVKLIAEHCEQLYEHSPNAILTDAGSTKQRVVEAVARRVPNARFVGSHPLAGSDLSGVEHADADLYRDRTVVVTPTEHTDPSTVEQVRAFWSALGAKVVEMATSDHDQALAATSHVPHVVASALAAATPESFLHLVAGGWRDSTRIAASDVTLWTQIVQENREHIMTQLRQVKDQLEAFETAIGKDDFETITRLLTAGKQRRDALGN